MLRSVDPINGSELPSKVRMVLGKALQRSIKPKLSRPSSKLNCTKSLSADTPENGLSNMAWSMHVPYT